MGTCECGNGPGETLIFACGGASHAGQVANRAALSLSFNGKGQAFCIAAVAARIGEKLERARKAARRVAVDGCEDGCVRKTLEAAGLAADVQVTLTTDLGLEKSPQRPDILWDARRAADLIVSKL